MRKFYIIALFIALFSTSLFAQTKGKVFVVEALVCDSTGTAIRDVAVYDAKNNVIGITDRDGVARFATRLDETLYFSHLSFNTKPVRIEKKNLTEDEAGHYSILVFIQRKTNTLQEVTVTENAPHLAYTNKKVWVIDYKVQHDGIYMLAGNGDESVLLHLGLEQDTISHKPVAPKYQELYRDAFNNLHLIGPDSTYQIYCDGKRLHLLYGCKKGVFNQILSPIVAATDSIIVLETWTILGQEKAFAAINRNNGHCFLLQDIGGETKEMARFWALDDKRITKMHKLAEEDTAFIDIQKETNSEIRNLKEDVKMRVLLYPVYCPLFGIGNKLYLFAFPEDALFVFDQNGQLERKIKVGFHKNLSTGLSQHLTSNNPWDKNLIFDPARMMMYAQFKSDGIVTLKEIDLNNGTIKREIRLTNHTFPQNIQVYNSEVYYLFLNNTQTAGRDRRSLYKMRLE